MKFKLVFCHRIPERTFKIGKRYFPVCARCTGLYMGMFFYFIFSYLFYFDYTILYIIFGVIMVLPTFIDGLTQLISLRESNNKLRFFTGLLGGIGLLIIMTNINFMYMY